MQDNPDGIRSEIKVKNLSKTFNREIILKDFSYSFKSGQPTAITGSNGSGKSTLLKLIAGLIVPNKGEISFLQNDTVIPEEKRYLQIGFCSPAQELIEEFTLSEMLDFHLRFRPLAYGITKKDFLKRTYFEEHDSKVIGLFSSGMKQRLKLGLALFSQSPILMLDEPTTNMDENGINWYREEILKLADKRLVIVASNQKHEYDYCRELISMAAYKGH